MKKFVILLVTVIALLAVATWWSNSLQSNDSELISKNGIHWHPILTIYIKGEKQEIPVNVGIGPEYSSLPTYSPSMGMTAIHTHDDAPEGIVHLEFKGIVRKQHITLGEFLKTWGKDINFFGTNPKMAVNGMGNIELGDYVMKDGDQIELRYE